MPQRSWKFCFLGWKLGEFYLWSVWTVITKWCIECVCVCVCSRAVGSRQSSPTDTEMMTRLTSSSPSSATATVSAVGPGAGGLNEGFLAQQYMMDSAAAAAFTANQHTDYINQQVSDQVDGRGWPLMLAVIVHSGKNVDQQFGEMSPTVSATNVATVCLCVTDKCRWHLSAGCVPQCTKCVCCLDYSAPSQSTVITDVIGLTWLSCRTSLTTTTRRKGILFSFLSILMAILPGGPG